jgi:hypothetical protein
MRESIDDDRTGREIEKIVATLRQARPTSPPTTR